MAANGNASKEDAGPLSGLQVIVGLFAGLAALIYLTGGAALGLRLLWAGLPALPVGQLPREFLFSLGAAQIIAPAVAIGVMVGLLELGQDTRALRKGHVSWSGTQEYPALRKTYITFYATIPTVLIAPGLVIAVLADDDVDANWLVACAVVAAALVALAVWIRRVAASALDENGERPKPPDTSAPDPPESNDEKGWELWRVVVLPGLTLTLLFGGLMWAATGSARYLGAAGAWIVALFFALLTVWVRSQAGEQARTRLPDPVRAADAAGEPPADQPDAAAKVPPWVIVISWCATALLVVPMLVAVTAAWPLSDAVVCSERPDKTIYKASGSFIGDAKDRVYIGDSDLHRIVSVPAGKVSRVLVGSGVIEEGVCGRDRDPPKAGK